MNIDRNKIVSTKASATGINYFDCFVRYNPKTVVVLTCTDGKAEMPPPKVGEPSSYRR